MTSFDIIHHIRCQNWTSGVLEIGRGSFRDKKPEADQRYVWVADQAYLGTCCFAEQPLGKAMESATSRDHNLSNSPVLGKSRGAPLAVCALEAANLLGVFLLRGKEDCPGACPRPAHLWAWSIGSVLIAVGLAEVAFPGPEIA